MTTASHACTDSGHCIENAGPMAGQILLQGRLRGLGVRPAIARLAQRLKLSGSVANTAEGVVIQLEGPGSVIDPFCNLPTLVQIRQVQRLVNSGIGLLTSSMGRLFDDVASIILGIGTSGLEHEPAMRLEPVAHEPVVHEADQQQKDSSCA